MIKPEINKNPITVSDRMIAVARSDWVRSRTPYLYLAWDLVGILIGWFVAISMGWRPSALDGLSLVVGVLVAYVFGGFSRLRLERPWSPTAGAAIGGLATCGFFLLNHGRQQVDLATMISGLTPVGWPVVARLLMGGVMRTQLSSSRWLIIGTPEVLSLMDKERVSHHLQGDFCYLSTATTGEIPSGAIGHADHLDRFLDKRWTGIVVASLEEGRESMFRSLMRARLAGVRIYDLTEFWELHLRKLPVLHLHAGWVVLSHGFQLLHSPVSFRLKRLSDIILAALGLALAWPLMLLTAIAVRVTSPGPIFFAQERSGARGKPFVLYKFRSMRIDAEKNGAQWAAAKDPRVTSIGGFIRKVRLDELPQLWNILKGDMSFIGPRPERPVFNDQLAEQIPFYHLRHVVKPGLTGWAQVNYPYGASIEDALEKLQYDLWYIKHYSLFLDLRIILKTVRVVLFGMGR